MADNVSLVQIVDFNVATVYVEDLQKALGFYTEVLGLRKTRTLGSGVLLTANDQLTVYLEGGRKRRDGEYGVFPETCLCFWPKGGVLAAFDKLREAGVTIVGDYMPFTGEFHMFRCADPSGNVIEFAGKPGA